MTRYIIPPYCDQLKTQRGYIKYTSRQDRRCNWIVAAIVAFGAGAAVCTLISEYSYLLGYSLTSDPTARDYGVNMLRIKKRFTW